MPLSPVCMYVCSMSTFSNVFSSETTGLIKVKFHMSLPWDGGTKDCSVGPDNMTKMATMPIYGKNLKKIFFSGTKRLMIVKLGNAASGARVLPNLFK